MRYRLVEKRLPQMLFPPRSESLESEFASLSTKIDEVLKQFDVRIVAAEEAVAVVQAMRNVEKIANWRGAASMRDPREHRFPDRARISSGWAGIRNAARRHPSAAFFAAPAIILAGALPARKRVGLGQWQGGGRGSPVVDIAAPDVAAPTAVDVQTDQKPKETRANGLAVCVRLCDGFFFPKRRKSWGGDEACAAQCPDTPTTRYTPRARLGQDGEGRSFNTQRADRQPRPAELVRIELDVGIRGLELPSPKPV